MTFLGIYDKGHPSDLGVMNMAKKVLFVDDEPLILRSLKRMMISQPYEVYEADNIQDAQVILTEQKIDLLVTDLKMPSGSGFELLKFAKEHDPLTMRIVLSCLSDKKIVFDAIGKNLAREYILKPWDNSELVRNIEQYFLFREKLSSEALLRIFNNLDELPSPPWVYFKIMQLMDEDADMEAIAAVIEQDQAITSRILRVANSAFFGARTGSIQEAMVYIGLTNISNIVLSSELYITSGAEGNVMDMLWQHAVGTNKLMNFIYRRFLGKALDNCYASAGLLHDIGKLLILHRFKEEQGKIQRHVAKNTSTDVNAMEQELIGADHQVLGGYLLDWWQMPLPINEVALYHHDPMNEAVINRKLVAVVHIASYYASRYYKSHDLHYNLVTEVFEELNIDREQLEKSLIDCPLE